MQDHNNKIKSIAQSSAFPATPVQTSLGQLVAPFPGQTRFEYYSSLFYANRNCDLRTAMIDALEFIKQVDRFMETLNENETTIIS